MKGGFDVMREEIDIRSGVHGRESRVGGRVPEAVVIEERKEVLAAVETGIGGGGIFPESRKGGLEAWVA